MSQYFLESDKSASGNVKSKRDLSNCTTKANLKGATGTDTSMLTSKTDLARLETKVDNFNVDKLKTDPTGLSNLSDVVDNDFAKNTVYDKSVININASDAKVSSTSGLITKTQYY